LLFLAEEKKKKKGAAVVTVVTSQISGSNGMTDFHEYIFYPFP